MNDRAYTVSELDSLRAACRMRFLFGTTSTEGPRTSRSFKGNDDVIAVEEIVRTHMAAGHVAQDIYDEDRAITEKWKARKARNEAG